MREGWLPPLVREREEKEAAGSAKGVLDRKKRKEGGVEKGAGRMREDNRGWRKRGRTKGAYRHRSSYPLVTPFILSVSVPPATGLKPPTRTLYLKDNQTLRDVLECRRLFWTAPLVPLASLLSSRAERKYHRAGTMDKKGKGEEKEEEEINSGKHESNLDPRNLVPAKLISFSIREIREKANLI